MPDLKATPHAIRWDGASRRLELLDQTLLPNEVRYEDQVDPATLWRAIKALKVRGAPAIGIAAAYGMVVAMRKSAIDASDAEQFIAELERVGEYLKSARPTAVNLAWAIDQQIAVGRATPTIDALQTRAERIHRDDIAMCRAIGEHGAPLITSGARVLTHCNAGALAVSQLGTATAPMYLAHERGVSFEVYADETRPLLQGARLTAWELAAAGVPVTLICDNMAASLMQDGKIDCVIVGTDRVAANGDVVNKIGTLSVAVLASHYAVPFYVACPASTYDTTTPDGAAVTIEQREAGEISGDFDLPGVSIHNPAFDVTPASLVTGYITDVGLLNQTQLAELAAANQRLVRA